MIIRTLDKVCCEDVEDVSNLGYRVRRLYDLFCYLDKQVRKEFHVPLDEFQVVLVIQILDRVVHERCELCRYSEVVDEL